jgi:hypothetical protein
MKKTILILSLFLSIMVYLPNDNYCFKKILIEDNTETHNQQTIEEDCAILIDNKDITTEICISVFTLKSFPLSLNHDQIWKPPDNI